MKVLFVLISVLYLVHSFSLEEENEAIELHDEIAVRDEEPLQAEVAVKEEARSCTARGQSCKSDCECCDDDWDKCSCTLGYFFCSCVPGTVNVCYDKQKTCSNKPKNCFRPGQNPRQHKRG
uniref:Cystine knot toxin n=1 Tax=Dolomedes sulfureus TaxID=492288 RepID=A0A0P0DIT8_9ARAC|nr:cystine knot toxin [Dolomedes sulfureus]